MYLQEAFRALDALNEDTFSVSDDGINKLAEFQNNDDLEDEIKVIDPDAETEEDLQDSYVGKVILDCAVCHSKLYKDKEEVELDEEGVMANVGEECPYCYTSDGFKVIGEVAAFGEAEDEETKEDEASEEEEKKGTETEEDNKVEESLTEALDHYEILDWLSEHEQAYEDAERYFKGTALYDVTVDDLISWIQEDDDLFMDFQDEFGPTDLYEAKVKESLTKTPSKEEITDPKSEPSSKQLSEKFFKSRKRIRESSYEDTDGIMGEKGTKWTEDQLRTYFDSEKDNDPVLKAYNGNADKWMQDTLKGMKKVNESIEKNLRSRIFAYARHNSDDSEPKYFWIGFSTAIFKDELTKSELLSILGDYIDESDPEYSDFLRGFEDNGGELLVDESKSIKEGYRGDDGLDDILGWLQDHKQAWEDFCIYFEDVEDEDLTQDMVVDWIQDHDQLYDDFLSYFNDEEDEFLDESKSLKESVNNVNVETDDSIVNVSTDDNGKVTVTTEPNSAPAESGDEIIAPVSPDTQAEIEGESSADAAAEDEFVDMEVDEFDEESFDGLGESYLKKVYENVDSYRTTSIKEQGNSIVVEGVISFKSGKAGKTSFLFEAKDCTKDGRVRFVGENAQLTKGKKSFTISGKVADKKFITESFNYNYRAKDKDGKSSRIYGTIKK